MCVILRMSARLVLGHLYGEMLVTGGAKFWFFKFFKIVKMNQTKDNEIETHFKQ